MHTTKRISAFLAVALAMCLSVSSQQSLGSSFPPAIGTDIGSSSTRFTGDVSTTRTASTPILTTGTVTVSSGTLTSGNLVWGSAPVFTTTVHRKASAIQLTASQIDRTAREIPTARLAPAAYLKLARDIDMDSPSTDEARMLDAIHSLGMKTYEFDKVDDYLQQKAQKEGPNVIWVWKPMRKKDDADAWHHGGWGGYVERVGFVAHDLYSHAVPAKVLVEAKLVLEKMPDAMFLISDYEVVKPDPFLAITTQRLLAAGKIWIVDRWDEPGFRPEVELTKLIAQK